jgi:hypothetical protein
MCFSCDGARDECLYLIRHPQSDKQFGQFRAAPSRLIPREQFRLPLILEIDASLSPGPLVNIQPDYLLSGLWGKSLLVCAYASQRTESHPPIEMRLRPEFVAAIVTLQWSCGDEFAAGK